MVKRVDRALRLPPVLFDYLLNVRSHSARDASAYSRSNLRSNVARPAWLPPPHSNLPRNYNSPLKRISQIIVKQRMRYPCELCDGS